MEEIRVNFAINQTQIALTLAGLLLFGLAYAVAVRKVRRRDPEHGYTALLVVFGNSAVVVGFTLLTSLALGALLLGCMAVAGAPMVWEHIDDHLSRREGLRVAARIGLLTKEGDEDGLHAQGGGLQVASERDARS